MTRHMWRRTDSQVGFSTVDRCAHCATERVRDASTKTLYMYRMGRAVPPSKKPLGEKWEGFVAGVIPKCPGPELRTPTESSSS